MLVDVVGTASSHSGDYGMQALLRQQEILSAAGIETWGRGERTRGLCASLCLSVH